MIIKNTDGQQETEIKHLHNIFINLFDEEYIYRFANSIF